MSAREEVLARVRTALGRDRLRGSGQGGASPDSPDVAITRGYRTQGEHAPGSPALLHLLTDRLEDYKAVVTPAAADDLPSVLATVLAQAAPTGRLVVPPGLPEAWTQGRDVLRDGSLEGDGGIHDRVASSAELDRVTGVVTGCAVAIAETGTIVLDASPDQGRRAITLVPDLHVCVVRAEQVVQSVPEALSRLDPLKPQTWISGPSATSDIELDRVEGVHGPRTLHVVLVS